MKKLIILLLIFVFISSNVKGEKQLSKFQVQESENLAQITLQQIADREEFNRKLTGGIPLTLGGGLLILGASSNDHEVKITSYILGGILAGGGLLRLAILSPAEKENAKLQGHTPEVKETLALNSLEFLANNAKRERIASGITSISSGIYLIANPSEDSDDIRNGLIPIGIGIYQLLNKSHIEKVYENVIKRKFAINYSLQNNSLVYTLNF